MVARLRAQMRYHYFAFLIFLKFFSLSTSRRIHRPGRGLQQNRRQAGLKKTSMVARLRAQTRYQRLRVEGRDIRPDGFLTSE
jgi:hypothetical protein